LDFSPEMTEFNDLLKELGWSRRELSRRLGLDKNTISHWQEPKKYAMAYLHLAVSLKRFTEESL
jgi:transcriptional regulator with XRE-family HTH domain